MGWGWEGLGYAEDLESGGEVTGNLCAGGEFVDLAGCGVVHLESALVELLADCLSFFGVYRDLCG